MKMMKYCMLFVLGAVLVSCGGGQVGPTAASGMVTQAEATALRTKLDEVLTKLDPSTLQNPTSIVSGTGITTSAVKSKAANPEDACSTITPANPVDADGDGIAASKDYVYNCYGISHGNYTYDKVGTVKIRDEDDQAIADGGGYSFEYDLTYDSGTHYNSWKGNYGLERTSTMMSFYSTFSSIFWEDQNNDKYEGSWESNFTYALEFSDETKPYDAGTATQEGFYRFILKGDLGVDGYEDIDWDITFKMKGEAEYELTSKSGCTYYYKSGYFEFTDEANNVIRYTYTCDGVTYSFNGTEITPI